MKRSSNPYERRRDRANSHLDAMAEGFDASWAPGIGRTLTPGQQQSPLTMTAIMQ
jgi:hypothetical protein